MAPQLRPNHGGPSGDTILSESFGRSSLLRIFSFELDSPDIDIRLVLLEMQMGGQVEPPSQTKLRSKIPALLGLS